MKNQSLVNLDTGKNAMVSKISAGRSANKRLYEMGFNTGSKFKVMKNDSGPVVVCLAGSKVAVGRGLAEKIIVSI